MCYINETILTHLVSPPTITKQPTDEVVGVYSSITFECKAQGYGYIDVQWRKLGSALPITAVVSNTKFKNEVSSIIKIMNLVGYHGGMYYCVAVNIAGQTSSIYTKLSVQGKPDIVRIVVALSFTV